MQFKFNHNNINVFDLQKSLTFYQEALGLQEVRRIRPEHGEFIIVFLSDGVSEQCLELTWLMNRKESYNLGDNEVHLAFTVDDFAAAYQHHKQMGCICYENKDMGIYFINDPDNYWVEILPTR